MTNPECAPEDHDLTVGVDPACKICGMEHDEVMRNAGFEEREGQWTIEFPAGQPIEFKRRR